MHDLRPSMPSCLGSLVLFAIIVSLLLANRRRTRICSTSKAVEPPRSARSSAILVVPSLIRESAPGGRRDVEQGVKTAFGHSEEGDLGIGGDGKRIDNRHNEATTFFQCIGRPRWVVAPMVDQSELPFRMLARRYGAGLCYTPMMNANMFAKSSTYRKELLDSACSQDRPLVVQFAGHDKAVLLCAARYVEHMCDAVDLNLGCPQAIAKRGRYGSFLLEEEDLVVDIVSHLAENLSVPVTCKLRLFRDDFLRTLRLCERLEAAGCALLTVHGRNRHQNKQTVGACDFNAIAAIKAHLHIPVIANGGIACYSDLSRCLEITGADGVMSSEAVLENPALFCNNIDGDGRYVDQNRIAREYLQLAERHLPPGSDGGCPKCVKAHLFKFLHAGLQEHTDLRNRVGSAHTLSEYKAVAAELEARGWEQPMLNHSSLYRWERSWYYRHRLREGEVTDVTAAVRDKGRVEAAADVRGAGDEDALADATSEDGQTWCLFGD